MTIDIPHPPITADQLARLADDPESLVAFIHRHPEEFARVVRERDAAARRTAPRIVGYWRPLRPRSQWADPSVPEVVTEPDLSMAEASRHAGVLASDLRMAGTTDPEVVRRRWYGEAQREAEAEFALPVPVPGSLSPDQAAALAAWLDGGRDAGSYRGASVCRICGASNGCAELERDGYRYPIGLIHYVRDHFVAVPGLEWVTG